MLESLRKMHVLKMQDEAVDQVDAMNRSGCLAVAPARQRETTKISAVIDGMGEGVALTDERGGIVDVNRCFATMAGLSRADCIGQPLTKFYPASLSAELEQVADTFQRSSDGQTYTKDAVRIFDLDAILRLQPIYTSDGFAGMVYNIVDVSPLVSERRRAQAASRAKSDFLANMSHELRTPLNHIIGFTELVLDQNVGELNGVQAEYLTDVLTSGRHLLSLINDILDLAKVESETLALQPKTFDLTQLLSNSLVLIKEKALKHQIRLRFDPPPFVINMLADECKIKQILYNLLANAVKFTPDKGEVELSLCLSERSLQSGSEMAMPANFDPPNDTAAWVCLRVRDTGIGLDATDMDRIFRPFEQVDHSSERRYEGVGLGLSLSQQLVTLHGGRIWAESPGKDQGSCFYVTLPRKVAPVAPFDDGVGKGNEDDTGC